MLSRRSEKCATLEIRNDVLEIQPWAQHPDITWYYRSLIM